MARVRILVVGFALMALLAGPATAFAAAPGNDSYGGATLIGSLPFDQSLDTSDATTDATDADANANCGAPATLASVWYDFTPSTDNGYIVDVSGSSYSAGVIVVSGSPGSFNVETCGPGTVSFFGYAATEYHILAFSDTAGVNGGTLAFHMEAAPPPPALTMTIDKVGHVNAKTGIASISGTWSCTGQADFSEIFGDLRQPVGRFTIHGSFDLSGGACDGTVQRWSTFVYPDNGKFAGGKSAAFAYTYACGILTCSDTYATQTVLLRK